MHRFSAVAVLTPSGQLLMQERGDDALHDPGRWGYPGGDLEAGEDFAAAAVRELHEETGLHVDASQLASLGVRRFRSETCGEDDEFELFVVRLPVTDDDVVCGEGRQMVFVDPHDLDGRELHQATALTLDSVLAWHAAGVRSDIVILTLVDPGGHVLMQERDEHARDPDMWCFPGGGLEPGEAPVDGAVRELAEETGIEVSPDDLTDLGEFVVTRGDVLYRYHCFVARATVRDSDVDCQEGRQIVFVDPARWEALAMTLSSRAVLPTLSQWIRDHPPTPSPDAHSFAGVILVDREGRILLQERDEHAPIDPEKWGLAGGHLDPGEDFATGAHRELEEETAVRLEPGGLELWREFVVDHTAAYGTWDRMQIFVASTDLTDADIDCREGRQIVFVDPQTARGLDLSSAATDIVPEFLDSDTYRRLRTRTPRTRETA